MQQQGVLFGEAGAVILQLHVQHPPVQENAEQEQLIDIEQEQKRQNHVLQPDALHITQRHNILALHQRRLFIRVAIYMNVHQRKLQYTIHAQVILVRTIGQLTIHPGVLGLTGVQPHVLPET